MHRIPWTSICKVRVIKEAPGPSVSEKIADIFRNYNIDDKFLFNDLIVLKWLAGLETVIAESIQYIT